MRKHEAQRDNRARKKPKLRVIIEHEERRGSA